MSINAGMSALGQKRTKHQLGIMSAFGGKADVIARKADIARWRPHADAGCPFPSPPACQARVRLFWVQAATPQASFGE